jgi:Sugar-specific transcriptional regulator TrmB
VQRQGRLDGRRGHDERCRVVIERRRGRRRSTGQGEVCFVQVKPRATKPAAMNDPVDQRVEQFVQEIVRLVQRACGESVAAVRSVLSTTQADDRRPAAPPKPAATVKTSRTSSSQARRHGTPSTAKSETASRRRAKSEGHAQRAREVAPATQRSLVPTAISPPSSAGTSDETTRPSSEAASVASTSNAVPDREAAILAALGTLGRATAAEIARRCEQPNGSVSVVLRSLVARGQVAKTQTSRGMEYSLIPARSSQPFNRSKASAAKTAP